MNTLVHKQSPRTIPSPRRKMTGMERYEYIHNRLFFTSHIVEAKLSVMKVRVCPYFDHHFPKHRIPYNHHQRFIQSV